MSVWACGAVRLSPAGAARALSVEGAAVLERSVCDAQVGRGLRRELAAPCRTHSKSADGFRQAVGDPTAD